MGVQTSVQVTDLGANAAAVEKALDTSITTDKTSPQIKWTRPFSRKRLLNTSPVPRFGNTIPVMVGTRIKLVFTRSPLNLKNINHLEPATFPVLIMPNWLQQLLKIICLCCQLQRSPHYEWYGWSRIL